MKVDLPSCPACLAPPSLRLGVPQHNFNSERGRGTRSSIVQIPSVGNCAQLGGIGSIAVHMNAARKARELWRSSSKLLHESSRQGCGFFRKPARSAARTFSKSSVARFKQRTSPATPNRRPPGRRTTHNGTTAPSSQYANIVMSWQTGWKAQKMEIHPNMEGSSACEYWLTYEACRPLDNHRSSRLMALATLPVASRPRTRAATRCVSCASRSSS